MKSVFDLDTKLDDLQSANQGLTDYRFHQIRALQNFGDTGTTNADAVVRFSSGEIRFQWNYSNYQWWVPSKSYLKIRCKLQKGDYATMLVAGEKVAPAMNLAANLFQQIRFTINDQLIEEIDRNVPQVDTLWKRLHKEGSYLNTLEDSTNFMQSNVLERIQHVSSNGIIHDKVLRVQSSALFLPGANSGYLPTWPDYAQPNQIEFQAFDGTDGNANILFTANGGAAIPDLRTGIEISVGDVVYFEDNAAQKRGIVRKVFASSLAVEDLDGGGALAALAAADLVDQFRVQYNSLHHNKILTNSQRDLARKTKQFELCWHVPLSLFRDYKKAIPGGSKCELILVPESTDRYRKLAIESIEANKTHATTAAVNDYSFMVEDIQLNVCKYDGQRVPQDYSYFLDLRPIRCQITQISAQDQEYSVDVIKSTDAIVCAFQDSRIGSNTLYSASKFISGNDEHDNLTRFYINYAGVQKPEPAFDIQYDQANGIDRFVDVYHRNNVNTGALFKASAETIQEWRERGMYILTLFPKDGSSRATRATIRATFSAAPANNPNMLIFELYKTIVRIVMQNGQVVEVNKTDI